MKESRVDQMSRKELAKVIADAIQTEIGSGIEAAAHKVEQALQTEIVPAIAVAVEESLQSELLATAVPALAHEVEEALVNIGSENQMRRSTDVELTTRTAAAAGPAPRRTTSVGTTGARVFYVGIPGRAQIKKELSARAGQVMAFIDRNRKASSAALQAALKVNRNVIAGAVHELKKAGVVRVEAFGPTVATAAEYQPRRKATRKPLQKRGKK